MTLHACFPSQTHNGWLVLNLIDSPPAMALPHLVGTAQCILEVKSFPYLEDTAQCVFV